MKTPTRRGGSSRPSSINNTPSRYTRSHDSPSQSRRGMRGLDLEEDIPIDPALLAEEEAEPQPRTQTQTQPGPQDMYEEEDAEGEEVDEDQLMIDGGGQWADQQDYVMEYEDQFKPASSPAQSSRLNGRPQRSVPRASGSNQPNETQPQPTRPRGRPKNASLPSSRSAPRLNGTTITTSHPPPPPPLLGKGKGKAKAGSLPQVASASTGGKVVKARGTGPGMNGTGHVGHSGVDVICSFCLGTNDLNKVGRPEKMVSCARCGRSGHPSCLNMISKRLIRTVMEYDWCCIECKTCEICEIKGDDNRLMFCDGCDRGWHSYCLNPPLVKPPKGQWLCPTCRSSDQPSHPGPSLSSSKSAPNLATSTASVRKGKGRAIDHLAAYTQSSSTPSARGRKSASVLDPLINGIDTPVAGAGSRVKIKSAQQSHQSLSKSASKNSRRAGGGGGGGARGRVPTEDSGEVPSATTAAGKMKIKIRVPSGNRRTVEVESEEEKVPFGGVITGADAETTRTTIKESDKLAFERSRKAAETKLGGPAVEPVISVISTPGSPAPSTTGSYFTSGAAVGAAGAGGKNGYPNGGGTSSAGVNGLHGFNNTGDNVGTPSKSTPMGNRSLRDRILNQSLQPTPGDLTPTPGQGPGTGAPGTPGSFQVPNLTGQQKIRMIRFGTYEIDTWFSSPYPEEYQHVPEGRLFICEFCFKYMKSGFVAERHRLKCKARHPPGDEIYRDGAVSVFEVDGRKNKIYCQNLCLLAKMFLDSKTLYYDVEPFLFYVMTEVDDMGARFVGYFSKEKRSLDNNVSCIMTLPVRQRKGWGQLLIAFSYLLSKKEERVGGPERPLSGLGEVTYKKYWSLAVMRYLRDCTGRPTLEDIQAETSMTLEDIFSTLKYENMISILDTPTRELSVPQPSYTNRTNNANGRRRRGGRSLASRRPRPASTTPVTESEDKDKVVLPERYEITWDPDYIEAVLRKHDSRGYLTLRPERLKYHPFLVSRNPQKPPGALARATLMANNPNQQRDARADADANGGAGGGADSRRNGMNANVNRGAVPNGTTAQSDETVLETPEKVNAGEDQATLDLVARLSGGRGGGGNSGGRSLRHRTRTASGISASEDDLSPNNNRSKRPRRGRSAVSVRRYDDDDTDAGIDEESVADDNEEEEQEDSDDPLRLGKGLNGTPRRGRSGRVPRNPLSRQSQSQSRSPAHTRVQAQAQLGSLRGTRSRQSRYDLAQLATVPKGSTPTPTPTSAPVHTVNGHTGTGVGTGFDDDDNDDDPALAQTRDIRGNSVDAKADADVEMNGHGAGDDEVDDDDKVELESREETEEVEETVESAYEEDGEGEGEDEGVEEVEEPEADEEEEEDAEWEEDVDAEGEDDVEYAE